VRYADDELGAIGNLAERSRLEKSSDINARVPRAKRTQPENRNDLNENWRATADEDGHYSFAVAL
jgi:hypothetical protein